MVKRLRKLVFIAIACSMLSPGAVVFAQSTQDFNFKSFNADYYLTRQPDKSSKMTVNETLVAEFPNFDQNHGILRTIPTEYKDHTLSLKINSVTDENGNNYPYNTSSNNGNEILKIGDANTYVNGEKIYKISYDYQDVISFYQDHDELFWDINGDQWQQPFTQVSAVFHIPADLQPNLLSRQMCYAGAFGTISSNNCVINRESGNNETLIKSSAANLGANQTLSVVLGFKPHTFTYSPAIAHEKQVKKIKTALSVIFAVLPPILILIFMYRRWRKIGDDPKGRGVIIPEYEPPKGLDVLHADFLLHEKFRNQALSALLIQLATSGHLVIYEIAKKGLLGKKDYELELKSLPGELLPESKNALQLIFGDSLAPGKRIKISDLKPSSNSSGLYVGLKSLGGNLSSYLNGAGYFSNNPKKIRNTYNYWGLGIVCVGGFLIFVSQGIMLVIALGGGIAVAGIIVMLFSLIMPARSEKGVEAYDALLGLKDYIKLAEADRLKFLQSPEGAEKVSAGSFDPTAPANKVKLFESLLPYAMIFGLEKEWAKQFQDIYKQPPDWYNGNWSSFNTGYLIGSLNSFSSASAANFSPPSSSSGSGFGGGGFSGGGGGGGGGGGW
jgi:uncharacterized membrane protein YgcG